MNFFTSLVVVCLAVYFCLTFGLKFYPRLKWKYPPNLTEAGILYTTLFVAGGILCGFSFLPFSVFLVLSMGGLLTLIIQQTGFSKKSRLILSMCLCLGSVLCLYRFSEGFLLMPISLALFWGLTWGLFVFFDRFSFVSYIVSLCWGISIVSIGLILRKIPEMIVVQSALLGTGVIAFSHFKFVQKKANLGKTVASLVGFMWGGVLTYFVNMGAAFQTFTFFGYYLFEGIILGMAFLSSKPLITLGERLFNVVQFRAKAMGIIFLHLLILSFFAAMMLYKSSAIAPFLLFVLIVILIDLYMRLNALEKPVPSWGEIFKNTKDSIVAMKDTIKEEVSHKKDNKKEKVPTAKPFKKKKVVVAKTSPKKKILKKKVTRKK